MGGVDDEVWVEPSINKASIRAKVERLFRWTLGHTLDCEVLEMPIILEAEFNNFSQEFLDGDSING